MEWNGSEVEFHPRPVGRMLQQNPGPRASIFWFTDFRPLGGSFPIGVLFLLVVFFPPLRTQGVRCYRKGWGVAEIASVSASAQWVAPLSPNTDTLTPWTQLHVTTLSGCAPPPRYLGTEGLPLLPLVPLVLPVQP